MGSQIALELSRRGKRVLGLDRFRPPHALGSSYGSTRMIREAYFEDPLYVPIVQRAYELWRQRERDGGEMLLTETGGLVIGARCGELVTGAIASAEAHDLKYELLSA